MQHIYVQQQMKTRVYFKSFGVKIRNEHVAIRKKSTNNFAGMVTTGVGADLLAGRKLYHDGIRL